MNWEEFRKGHQEAKARREAGIYEPLNLLPRQEDEDGSVVYPYQTEEEDRGYDKPRVL